MEVHDQEKKENGKVLCVFQINKIDLRCEISSANPIYLKWSLPVSMREKGPSVQGAGANSPPARPPAAVCTASVP